MKTIKLLVLSSCISFPVFSQTITWSPDEVKPKQNNMYTGLAFPGADGNNYYVNEFEAGGVSFKPRKWKDYITVVDKVSLKVKSQIDLNETFKGSDLDLYSAENFFFQGSKYYFFVNRDNKEKNVYDIYCSVQKMDVTTSNELIIIGKVDRRQSKPFSNSYDPKADKETKEDGAGSAANYIRIKPANDGKTIISALITEVLDENYSTLNIAEWDKDMKTIHSNNFKIPYKRRQIDKRTTIHNGGVLGEKPEIIDFAKDYNGFVYVLIYSADPGSPDAASKYSVYQFKLSDPAYMKVFTKEINKNIATADVHLFQDESGKIFFSNIGVEIEDEKDKKKQVLVNAAVIGSFNDRGEFVTIYDKRIPVETMYKFEKEKWVNKDDGKINGLEIENILASKDGGCFVVWNYHEMQGAGTDWHNRSDNALVQYFDNSNKLKWEKLIYKEQKGSSYLAGMTSFVQDGNLYVAWPDDPSNEKKTVDDDSPTKFSAVRFGNDDLAGIFLARFTSQGEYTRKYLHWPKERNGYAFICNSLKRNSKNEFIGTARVYHQGVALMKAEEYSFFKITF